MGICVAQADVDQAEAFVLGKVSGSAMEADVGGSGGIPRDLKIDPIELWTDADAEGFGQGFLGSETCGIAAKGGGTSERVAVGDLAGSEDAVAEAVAVFGEAPFDAGDLDEVGADAVDGHFLSGVGVHEFAHFGNGMVEAESEGA